MTTGFIYKICCKNTAITNVYIGSTKNLVKRRYEHKHNCINSKRKSYNYPLYRFIRANGGFDNWEIIQIENCEIKTSEELKARERFYYEQETDPLNKQMPNRSQQEWMENNKEYMQEYMKKYNNDYYQKNREKIKQNRKQRYLKQKAVKQVS